MSPTIRDLYEHVLTLSNHGRARGQTKQFWADMVGFKYKMSNIQAAIGCAQMERIDDLINRKREIFSYYRSGFAEFPTIAMNPEDAGTVNGFWMPNVVFDDGTGVTREKLQAAFADANADARVFFWPLSSLPPFRDSKMNKTAWDIPARAINLPSFHDITSNEQDRVISVIRECINDEA